MTPNILFVGLGKMGLPMAMQLAAAGLRVRGLDKSDGALAASEAAGIQRTGADDEPADIVITVLPDDAVVHEALLGAGGLADRMAPGGLVIEMSSSAPKGTIQTAAALEERGLTLVDAPVSGGVVRAEKGDLAIMVGGTDDDVARARPVLEPMARSIVHAGPVGAGHAAKALNNFVSATGLVATCQALIVAERFGIAPETMTDVLNGSSGKTNTSEAKLRPFILSGRYDSGFALALMAKDLGIANTLAKQLRIDADEMDQAVARWVGAAEALGPEADHTEMHRHLQSTATKAATGV